MAIASLTIAIDVNQGKPCSLYFDVHSDSDHNEPGPAEYEVFAIRLAISFDPYKPSGPKRVCSCSCSSPVELTVWVKSLVWVECNLVQRECVMQLFLKIAFCPQVVSNQLRDAWSDLKASPSRNRREMPSSLCHLITLTVMRLMIMMMAMELTSRMAYLKQERVSYCIFLELVVCGLRGRIRLYVYDNGKGNTNSHS